MYRLRNTYRILALTMAFLMLFTSVGFSMDMHYCQGQLKSISLIGKAKNCHELQDVKSDHCKKAKKSCNHSTDNISQKEAEGCCSNITVIVDELDEDFFIADYNIENNSLDLLATCRPDILADALIIDKNINAYLHYKPPETIKDYQSFFQVFII